MTDMDWADEIAKGMIPSYGPPSLVHCHYDHIAAALRKAKADGMREAAEIIKSYEFNGEDAHDVIVAKIDKLENLH